MNHLSDFVHNRHTRTPKTSRGRRTLLKLLDAAAEEFGTRGFHQVAIGDITARAGIAMGTFYVYFESKEAVFRALVDHMGHVTRRWIAERVAGSGDRLSAERQGTEAFLEFVRTHKNLYRIVMEAQFVAPDAHQEYYFSFAEAYARHLGQAAERGDIRPGFEEERAWALIGMNVFLGFRFAVWDETRPPTEVADAIADFIEGGLRPA